MIFLFNIIATYLLHYIYLKFKMPTSGLTFCQLKMAKTNIKADIPFPPKSLTILKQRGRLLKLRNYLTYL